MEQPPSSTEQEAKSVEELIEPAFRREQEEKERQANIDLEHFGKAVEVAEDVPAIEEAIQGLHPGEKILINGVRRMEDGGVEVRFDHNGVQETKIVKFQE